MQTNLQKDIRKLVSQVIKIPEDRITPSADFFSDLGIDSLLAVEILAAVDRKYNINIPDEKIKDIRNLESLIAAVENLLTS